MFDMKVVLKNSKEGTFTNIQEENLESFLDDIYNWDEDSIYDFAQLHYDDGLIAMLRVAEIVSIAYTQRNSNE